jgi:hypothetical protein
MLGDKIIYGIQSPVYNSCFIPRVLVQSSPWFPSHFFFSRFAHNLMLLLCQIHREIVSGQIHDAPPKKDLKVGTWREVEVSHFDITSSFRAISMERSPLCVKPVDNGNSLMIKCTSMAASEFVSAFSRDVSLSTSPCFDLSCRALWSGNLVH